MLIRNLTFPQIITRKRTGAFAAKLIITISITSCSLLSTTPIAPVTALPITLTVPTHPNETAIPSATDTPFPRCTPPPCKENESYYCSIECPGGCGTTCATHTPTTDNPQPTLTHQLSTVTLQAQTNAHIFPNPADYQWTEVISGLSSPVGLVHAGDGSNRLFILEQKGQISILQNRELLLTPFLDIRSRVGSKDNEQGLLGLAFHPNFEENGQFFINYTDLNGNTVVSRFHISGDPGIADPDSEYLILRVDQPYGNHNGGHLIFGPDGYLYIGLGDGGSGGDPKGHGQNRSTLLGSMLRIDIDNGSPYAIPPENPYVSGNGLAEIWATGLRNPWRYSFDRSTGDLYIGDVGQNQWEEIHFQAASGSKGVNFGWNFWEGLHPFKGSPPEEMVFDFPIWEYGHDLGCSVTGGFVYRGSMPEWLGIYLYGDFCSGRVWGLLQDRDSTWQNTELFKDNFNITSFGEDESGELFLVDRSGKIYKLTER